jgi:hypothetical protein
MIIPSAEKPAERHAFYTNLVRQCSASRRERFEFYKVLRNYYLFGTASADGCSYNKIASTIETRWSFMYAPAATRFSIHLGSSAPREEIYKVKPLVHELNDQWRMGQTHLMFDVGGKWAHVFGCVLFKMLWKKGIARTYLVEPHQFGVLREDNPRLEDQEAFTHFYQITKTQLESMLEEHPRKEEILRNVRTSVSTDGDMDMSSGLSRLILSAGVATSASAQVGGSVDGGINNTLTSYDYSPKVEAELIDMIELYVWDDEEGDYQMVTLASPNVVIFDRRQTGVAGVPCFVKLCPEANLYDYFWGASYVAKLTRLQDWRTQRMDQIAAIMEKQANPPLAFSGWSGITDEKWAAMQSAGGIISSSMPNGKVDNLKPDMPANIFSEVDQIDRMFDDTAGISHILQGKGEAGVRSKGQADLLARLGSARPKAAAVVVEECAEDLATLILRAVQDNSKQRFVVEMSEKRPTGFFRTLFGKKSDGTVTDGTALIFTADQFTNDYEVKVDSHSSSPIFFEDRKKDAIDLFDRHAITRERLIEAFDPADKQLLMEELKGIEATEAEQRAQQQAQGGGPAKS